MKNKLKIIFNCFISLLIIVLLISLFVFFVSRENDVANIGGYSILSVKGDSMDPKIKNGDLIVIGRKKKNEYEVGDIVSFTVKSEDYYAIITHEIVDIDKSGSEYLYYTKGVNNVNNDNDFIINEQIIGQYKNFRIPLVGYIVSFANTEVGYLLLIVLPLGVVLSFVTFELYKEISKKKEEF